MLSKMSKRSKKDKQDYLSLSLPPLPLLPSHALLILPRPFSSLPSPHLTLQTEISRRLFREGKVELVEGQLHQTDKLEARKQVNRDLLAQTQCRHTWGQYPSKGFSCNVQPRG